MWKCLWLPFKKWTGVGTQSPRLHAAQNFKRERSSQLNHWTKVDLTKEKYNARVWFRLSGAGNRLNRNRGMQALLQKVWLGLVTWSHLRPILTFDSQLSKKSTHGLDLRQFRRRVALAGLNVGKPSRGWSLMMSVCQSSKPLLTFDEPLHLLLQKIPNLEVLTNFQQNQFYTAALL